MNTIPVTVTCVKCKEVAYLVAPAKNSSGQKVVIYLCDNDHKTEVPAPIVAQ